MLWLRYGQSVAGDDEEKEKFGSEVRKGEIDYVARGGPTVGSVEK